MKNTFYIILLISLIACNNTQKNSRLQIDLQGKWQFALDTAMIGEEKKWYLSDFVDTIDLPGTTDSNQKGFKNNDTTTLHLNRLYKYEGAAWYRKEIIIPEDFENKHIQLILERTRCTKVWVDSTFIGESKLLQSAQMFETTDVLSPGKHYITVLVNNDLRLTPYGNVHIYTDDSQTNWNGIIGEIYLEASAKTFISNLQVRPDAKNKKAVVKLDIENGLNTTDVKIELIVNLLKDGKSNELESKKLTIKYQPSVELEYELKDKCEFWDEYEQPIYQLTAKISGEEFNDEKTVQFGMRDFAANNKQFTINGRTTFLRGKHEAAVFPLTAHPPMNVEEWKRVYKIAKEYGINHYRFHSYCPPEAAFVAADQVGIYLQAELPFWGGLNTDTVAQQLQDEGLAMLKAYANHPSFVMISPGNEIWGGHDKVEKVMLALKEYDDRPLYAMGSNNNIGYMAPQSYCDFFVGARIPKDGHITKGHARLTHAFADAENGGILNTQTPSTDFNFAYAIENMDIPLVSHEIGQYQIYPNYNEIDKYIGVLQARNFEVFKKRLNEKGIGQMDSTFQKASGAWSALCYKAEMEAALRTPGMAGFQLLDLQDFPGQGTALVGILDAFMDSKNVVTAENWKYSCNDVTLLLEFPKYCWTGNENFQAKLVVTNYSNKGIKSEIKWQILEKDSSVFAEGSFPDLNIENGGLLSVGEIKAELNKIGKAKQLDVEISIPGTEYKNTYPIWVYPSDIEIEAPKEIVVTEEITISVLSQLEKGSKVLLFPKTEDVKNKSFAGHFPPEFWNYGMFKTISENVKKPVSPGTLGILTDPKHPLFNSFPTNFHTNWQWFSIVKNSNSLILDSTPNDYLPIVQVIDNLERNHKLGLIFEFKIGEGKLLVCMSQLNELKEQTEAVQLYQSILNYMDSDDFNPVLSLTKVELMDLL